MKRHFFALQIKILLKQLPQILGSLIVFMLLGIASAFAASTSFSQSAVTQMQIATVLPEDDALVQTGFNMVSQMDSLQSYCVFIPTDEVHGIQMVKTGQAFGLVIIPQGFVEDVMNGTNTPARIILPSNPGFETLLFRYIIDAGANTLGYAQAGIYALADTYRHFSISDDIIISSNKSINISYMDYALAREKIYTKKEVAATGNLSPVSFYFCTAILLILLFSGMTTEGFINSENQSLSALLNRKGISVIYIIICKTAILWLFYSILLFAGIALLHFSGTTLSAVLAGINLSAFIPGACIMLFSICAFNVMIYTLCGKGVYGIMVSFLICLVMTFSSGLIIPAAYLPKPLGIIGSLLPSSFWHNELAYGIGLWQYNMQTDYFISSAACIIYGIVFLIIAIAAKGARHE